jgi:hypothetical protein
MLCINCGVVNCFPKIWWRLIWVLHKANFNQSVDYEDKTHSKPDIQTLPLHSKSTMCKECITMHLSGKMDIFGGFHSGVFTMVQSGQKLSYLTHTSCSSSNMCNCNTLMHKSISLNAYGMLHPRGPNVRRSWTTAWKKHSPNSNLLKLSNCLQLSKNSGSLMGWERYDLRSEEKKNQHCMSHPLLTFITKFTIYVHHLIKLFKTWQLIRILPGITRITLHSAHTVGICHL